MGPYGGTVGRAVADFRTGPGTTFGCIPWILALTLMRNATGNRGRWPGPLGTDREREWGDDVALESAAR